MLANLIHFKLCEIDFDGKSAPSLSLNPPPLLHPTRVAVIFGLRKINRMKSRAELGAAVGKGAMAFS